MRAQQAARARRKLASSKLPVTSTTPPPPPPTPLPLFLLPHPESARSPIPERTYRHAYRAAMPPVEYGDAATFPFPLSAVFHCASSLTASVTHRTLPPNCSTKLQLLPSSPQIQPIRLPPLSSVRVNVPPLPAAAAVVRRRSAGRSVCAALLSTAFGSHTDDALSLLSL